MKKNSMNSLRGLFAFLTVLAASPAYSATKSEIKNIRLDGYIGQRINGCIEKRVLGQPVDEIVEPFRLQDEVHGRWASEFWGKWIQGAIASYQYNHDSALLEKIKDAEKKLISMQLPDGYIGDYDKDHQLQSWDVWGRKYTLLGLIKCYRLLGDKAALNAAIRLLDYTIGQIGPQSGRHINQLGLYRGMPPLSILEPVTFMYNETGYQRYMDFAIYITDEMDNATGPQLITKCDIPVSWRFPIEERDGWWCYKNGQKGYEMMSCYVGLLEMYRLTGNDMYLHAAQTAWQHILDEEINIAGGACSLECWYDGHARQTHPAAHTMETCVTFTWMQFCERLYGLTGDAKYIDQIERTMYNALMASMKDDCSQIVKYVPLEGFRREGENQCGVNINCCNANAPRAFAMIPRVAYSIITDHRVDVNLYIPSTVELQLGKRWIEITQHTSYPENGHIDLVVSPDKSCQAQIALRIPAWAPSAEIKVNDENVELTTEKGYVVLDRVWQRGDRISVQLEMDAHPVKLNQHMAIERGPVVFARDSRFNDGFVDEVVMLPWSDKAIEITPVKSPDHMWMAFTIPLICGTYSDAQHDTRPVHFCDLASAGNTWDQHTRYRVWLPLLYEPLLKGEGGVKGYW